MRDGFHHMAEDQQQENDTVTDEDNQDETTTQDNNETAEQPPEARIAELEHRIQELSNGAQFLYEELIRAADRHHGALVTSGLMSMDAAASAVQNFRAQINATVQSIAKPVQNT